MKLSLGTEAEATGIAGFFTARFGKGYERPELLSEARVAAELRNDRIVVLLATEDDQILGCALGYPQLWNQSLELGQAIVAEGGDPKLADTLFEGLRRLGLKGYGVTYLPVASEAAFKRMRSQGAVCWGFRPRPGLATYDDCELLMGFIAEDGDERRVQPPDNSITGRSFAARIHRGLDPGLEDVPYPKTFPVGEAKGTGTPVISGQIWPTYHSEGNYITIESTAGRAPLDIVREFVEKARKKGVKDFRLNLPVNHTDAFDSLVSIGFRPVAYLPGWYLRGTERYDCIQLVAGMPATVRRSDSFRERAVFKISEGLK